MEIKNDKEMLTNAVFEALNTTNFEKLEPLLDDNIVFEFPGTPRIEGKKRMMIMMKTLLRKFPVLTFDVYDMIIEDDKACAIWTNKGESNKGEPYENQGVTVHRFANNKITYISDYFKDTSFINS